jgi:pimeloyl-ACP methyl ester carboxylesterase
MSASAASPETQIKDLQEPSLLLRYFVLLLCVGVGTLIGFAIFVLPFDLRGYAVLMHFADPNATGPLLRLETHAVTTQDVTISMPVALLSPPAPGRVYAIPAPTGTLRARLYIPVGVKHPAGMVAVHGIHHLGMDEPRLVNFARAVAGSGLAVLTPQIDSLADYHVDADSIGMIGESAAWLDDRLGDDKVTVTGISFAGGLSLMAARDAHYASHMRALVLMGAYDDLARVSRFLATGVQELPDGTREPHPAHDYGASVFVYAHLSQFFPPADLDAAHEALRDWLWEQPDKAKIAMEKLSTPARATMDALLNRRIDEVRPRILSAIQADEAELAVISPHGRMDGLRVPVYILHGSADNIIPPAESLWLAKDIPRAEVRDLLITGAFSHVDPEKNASLKEDLRLVKFVGDVLRAAN